MRRRLVACLLGGAVATAACAPAGGGSAEAGQQLRVAAAASLAGPFQEIERLFEAQHPGVDVILNLAGSSQLREQILAGSGEHVLASASQEIMDELQHEGVVDGTPVVFASNPLVIIVPPGNPAEIVSIDDLARPDLLVGLCAPGVPCGDLARRLLDAHGVAAAVDTNEPNALALRTKVELGELDAAISYLSDGVTGLVDIIRLESTIAAHYPIAVLVDAPAIAADFVSWVAGAEGTGILADHGFSLP